MKVIKPKKEFFEEYLNACKESYENNITEWMPFNPNHFEQWKSCILDVYRDYELGVNIPAGMPRTYTYWCVENDSYIGEIQLRPFLSENEAVTWGHLAYSIRYSKWNQGYGTKLLKKALEISCEFQISDVYVVCRESNIGSVKVIEKNKGRLVNKIEDDEGILNNVYHISNS